MSRLTTPLALGVLKREAAAFSELLDQGDQTTPVPSCPGWTVQDLARHLGQMHRWAREAVRTGEQPAGSSAPSPSAELVPWFREGAAQLLAELSADDPDRPCWGFGPPPHTVGFWARRQAHETSLHRWDVEVALTGSAALDEELARDGLAEVATVFLPRQLRLGRIRANGGALAVHPDDGAAVLLDLGATPEGTVSATVHGPASVLLLLLWGRTTPDDPRVTIDGDRGFAQATLSLALTP